MNIDGYYASYCKDYYSRIPQTSSQYQQIIELDTIKYIKNRLQEQFQRVSINELKQRFQTKMSNINIIEKLQIPLHIDTHYQICISIYIQNPMDIKFEAVICKNCIPLKIKSKHLMLDLLRYLGAAANYHNIQSFKVNPENRLIKAKLGSIFRFEESQLILQNKQKLFEFIKRYTLRLIKFVSRNSIFIMQLINQIPHSINKKLPLGIRDYRQIRINDKNLFHEDISNMIMISHMKLSQSFTQNQKLKKKLDKAGDPHQITNNKNKNIKYSKDLIKQIGANNITLGQKRIFFDNYEQDTDITKKVDSILKKLEQAETKKYLQYPVSKSSNHERNNIMPQISIQSQIDPWHPININDSIIIDKAKVQYYYHEQNESKKKQSKHQKRIILTKLMVRKVQRYPSGQERIKKQKQLLKSIAEYHCPHIAKFYQSNQPLYKNSLLMDYYTYKSLQIYKSITKKTLSLYNILYMICQTIQGMRYYSQLQLVHLDIKPGNTLVGKSLIVRISDFGQAKSTISNKKIDSNVVPSYTFPYTPPDLFSTNQKNPLDISSDVYSLGVMIYQLIFEKFPIQIRCDYQLDLIQDFKTNKSQMKHVLLSGEDLVNYGDTLIMMNIRRLCLKCMDPVAQKRPNLDWLIIIMRELVNQIENRF